MKRLLHRMSSHNIKRSHSEDSPPPLPTPTHGAQNGVEDSASSQEETRRGTTLPNQPATLTTAVTVTAMSTEEAIWKGINNPNGNVSKAEKFLNRAEDGAGAAASASSGIVATVKAVAANEVVKEVASAVMNGMPALMSTLETLSKVHPFAAVAFLPFQFAYKQEMKRHDNEKNRISLFEAIKDVMLVTIEMKGVGITPDDQRRTPDGQPIVTRLAALGEQMKKDIEGCYNALDAMQKQSLIVKFCKAGGWSDQLAKYKVTFKTRREEFHFALDLNTATTIQDMSQTIKEMQAMQVKFMKEFQAMRTPEDRKIEAYFNSHGGMEAVMADDTKCAVLIKLQNDLRVTHNIQSTYAAGSGPQKKAGDAQESGKADPHKAELAALRKEYRSDVAAVIEENMESFLKRLDLSLHLLSEDLKSDIHQEGDRMIKFLKGGPHLRLRDKIMRQVWKDQGWRGSAKTRTLVLALRDYLVERAEHADSDISPSSPVSPSGPDEEDPQDPETAMGVPLPDSWMLEYLQVKRLRNLQQVLDPDTSGFSTISEVNAFTQSCHKGWSLPRWISYWAVGWQIYATRYSTEIDGIFAEMLLVRDQVAVRMPGNKRAINNYLQETWPIVVGLTSGLERFEGTDWLAGQFKEYVNAQETAIRSRLDRIQYDIDSSDTVHEIIRGEPIERSVFMLIAIILRRHLVKMRCCMTTEMSVEELFDDTYTVKFVVEAAWMRYNDLVEYYKHQQIVDMKQNFEWFACGLFRNYFTWNDWTSEEHYRKNQIISYSVMDENQEISPMEPEEMKEIIAQKIIVHELKPLLPTGSNELKQPIIDEHPMAMVVEANGSNPEQPLQQPLPETDVSEQALTIEVGSLQLEKTINGKTFDVLPGLQASISGLWFGFLTATTEGRPVTGMLHFKITASIQPGKTELTFEGEGSSFDEGPEIGTIEGTVTSTPDGKFKIKLEQKNDREADYIFEGLFEPDRQIISGLCTGVDPEVLKDINFLVKKTPTDSIMCHRPVTARRLDAKELWSFAYAAVVGELHRRKPSLAYFSTRMGMIKRCLELLHRRELDEEYRELSSLRSSFTVLEYIEIRKLAAWYNRVGDLQPALYCDSCYETISRSRILCMDCESKDGPSGSVEFDAKEDCISTSTLPNRSDLLAPHLPTHLLLKTRDILLLKDYSLIKSRATNCFSLADRLYSRATSATTQAVATEEAQTTSVTVIVEVTLPAGTGTDDLSIQPSPPVMTSESTGDHPQGATEDSNPEVPNESNVDNNPASSHSPDPPAASAGSTVDGPKSEMSASDTNSTPPQIPPPAADTGGSQGTADSVTKSEGMPDADISEAADSDNDDKEEEDVESITLNCLICRERVSTPCWYCIDCKVLDAFVCNACEKVIDSLFPWDYHRRIKSEYEKRKENRLSDSGVHSALHMLIRFGNPKGQPPTETEETSTQDPTPEQKDLDRRLRDVEQRLNIRMDEDKKQIQDQVGAVEQRLARIEALLLALLPPAAAASVPVTNTHI